MTVFIALLMEPCHLLSWLALVFVVLTPGFATAEESEKVLVTVTESAANMMKVFNSPVMTTKDEFEGCDSDNEEEVDSYLWATIMNFSDTKQHTLHSFQALSFRVFTIQLNTLLK